MNHRSEPAIEISPDYQISPPVYNIAGNLIPDEVTAANTRAAAAINQAKDKFLLACLDTILPPEDIGEAMLLTPTDPGAAARTAFRHLDPEKCQLTLRNDYSPTLVLPNNPNPHDKKQKAIVRQTGHTLTFNYDDRWIGTMEIEYRHDGTIGINVTTK